MAIETEQVLPQETKGGQKHLQVVAKQTYDNQKEALIDEEQITRFLPMVHKIVQRVTTYLRPPLSYDDLIAAGSLGLVKAARDYDPSRNAEFQTYAYIKIRGAILDELRGWSFVPASVTKQISDATRLSAEISEETGQVPSDELLAEKLNIPIDKLYKMFESARAKNFVSIDKLQDNSITLVSSLMTDEQSCPARHIEKSELIEKLTEAITQLDERQRQVIVLYYQQELTMKQIAEVFEITEPRVSQIHAKALFNLSVKLRQWQDV